MRFSELANFAVNDVATGDILPTTDISANIDKKITMQNLFSWIATKAKATFNGTSQTIQAAINACVPNTRTVNGKALSNDVSLSASDVGAVPTSRTVNGHALTGNISVTLADLKLAMSVAMSQVGFYLNASNHPYIRWTDSSSNNYQWVTGSDKLSYQTKTSDGTWVKRWSLSADGLHVVNGNNTTASSSSDITLCNTDSLGEGVYLFKAVASFGPNTSGFRVLFFSYTNTGATISRFTRVKQAPISGQAHQMELVSILELSANSKIFLRAYQNSGATLDMTDIGITYTRLSGEG